MWLVPLPRRSWTLRGAAFALMRDELKRRANMAKHQAEVKPNHADTQPPFLLLNRNWTYPKYFLISNSSVIFNLIVGGFQPDDWYTVTLADAHEVGLPKTTTKMQLVELLQERYPTQDWSRMYTTRGRFGNQRLLYNAVASLFPVSSFQTALCVDLSLTGLHKATGGDCQRAERSGFSKSWDGASTWDRCLRSLATARIRVLGWLLLYSKALLFYICFFITDFYTGEASLRQRYGDGR